MTTVTRRYAFSASHRLHVRSLSESENARIFGKCNNPFGHGHNYTLSVSVCGDIDASTGVLVPIAALDDLVHRHVLHLLDHRNLNTDVPQFRDLVPTTENLAVLISGLLYDHRDELNCPAARLHSVHVQETDRNSFEVLLPRGAPSSRLDSVEDLVHA